MKSLPDEIWLMIIDILGVEHKIRDMTNLIDALGWNITPEFNKYIHNALEYSRYSGYSNTYDEKMIELFERTGIDDGCPPEFLVKNLNKRKRMYRTIFSYEVWRDSKENKYFVFPTTAYELVTSSDSFRIKHCNDIFLDTRQKPRFIPKDYYCYYYNNKKLKSYLQDYTTKTKFI